MINFIVAYGKNRVIGVNNQLPWKLSADLQFFKKITFGHPILMGRKTWDSLGRPLPGRRNLVITRQVDFQAHHAEIFTSLPQAIDSALSTDSEIFIIGGEQIFQLAMPLANRIYATEVNLAPQGDAFFPELGSEWQETQRQAQQPENNIQFDFVTYEKR